MQTVRVKICGVTTPADGRHAAEAGADAVGLNFYPKSPRFLTPAAAAAVVRGLQTYDDRPPDEDPFPFAHVPAFRVADAAGLEVVRRYVDAARAAGRPP